MTWDYKKLERIKGIGEETAKTIVNSYDTEDDLILALSKNKTGLKSDIVNKLNEYYENIKLDENVEEVIEHDLSNMRCNSCNLPLPINNDRGICPHCGRIN